MKPTDARPSERRLADNSRCILETPLRVGHYHNGRIGDGLVC